jgi:hypothetical protein
VRRNGGALTGALAVSAVVAVAALAGCSSSSGDDDKKPTATGAGTGAGAGTSASAPASAPATGGKHGHLDYSGSLSGGFDVTMSVGCATLDGKLIAVTAPDPGDAAASTTPSFVANIGDQSMATLVTPDKHTFVKLGADGISAAKQGDAWTVTVSGTELGAVDTSGGSVTVNGTLTCTKVSGT